MTNNTVTLDREQFQQNDISTQLDYLAANLEQMRSLVLIGTDSDKVVSLMCESRYYIDFIFYFASVRSVTANRGCHEPDIQIGGSISL
ncbi:hypothetical protein NIES4101_47450 [Calothrix sp. NIES-4101]|nr:hypothetical protein NIES4101_47450 [Calothrix sp. NIES-4101]